MLLFQVRTIYGILLPIMLVDGLGQKRRPKGSVSKKNTSRVDNPDKDAHRMLFILLGQVIQLLCVRRITRADIDTADNILRCYNTLFVNCFPDRCRYNQHFNSSHLKGKLNWIMIMNSKFIV
jgi:predicted restriction endonuclease